MKYLKNLKKKITNLEFYIQGKENILQTLIKGDRQMQILSNQKKKDRRKKAIHASIQAS